MAANFLQDLFYQLLELKVPELDPANYTWVLALFVFAADTSKLGFVVAALGSAILILNAVQTYLDIRMDKTANESLIILKSSSHSVDAKVTQLTKLKSEIKQRNVPDAALSTVFTATRSAIASPHQTLSSTGFGTLSTLLKRLYLQEHYNTIAGNGRNFYPLLLDRLGDHKEPIRSQAAQAFTEFWSAAPSEVEHQVLETALVGKNAKAREASINWLLTMSQEHDLRYRSYVPSLISCLEDADSGVREAAKKTVVELFSNGPSQKKSDLKRELQVQNVRKSIVTAVMSAIEQNELAIAEAASTPPQSEIVTPEPPAAPSVSESKVAEPKVLVKEPELLSVQQKTETVKPETVKSEPEVSQPAPDSESEKLQPDISTSEIKVDDLAHDLYPPPEKQDIQITAVANVTDEPLAASSTSTSTDSKTTNPVSSGQQVPRIAGSDTAPTPVVEQGSSSNAVGYCEAPELTSRKTCPRELKSSAPIIGNRHAPEAGPEVTEPVSLASPDGEKIEAKYVDSRQELEGIFRDMGPHFEGKEVESNWGAREQDVTTLRRLVRGNAPRDYSHNFIGGIKSLLDGIQKTIASLRTTVSTRGCYLIQDLARACGSGIDPMVDILLQSLIKLCGGAKKISAQNGNSTVDVVISHVTYNSRILQHIWQACQDKNIQPRLFAAGWLKTIINRQSRVKSSIEHGGGLETVEKALKKGLADSNPGVREASRSTYWTFAKVWPQKAECIISSMDAKSRGLLEKHADNPNFDPAKQQDSKPKRSVAELKAAIHAQRKALRIPTPPHMKTDSTEVQKEPMESKSKSDDSKPNPKPVVSKPNPKSDVSKPEPARPESAQASFADVKPNNDGPIRPKAKPGIAKGRGIPASSSTTSSTSTLSSAPVRPAARSRKPEIPRPATADPYSKRQAATPGTKSKPATPLASPQKNKTNNTENLKLGSPAGSPARPKPRLGYVSTTMATKPKKLEIPRTRPKQPKQSLEAIKSTDNSTADSDTPTKTIDDITVVVPPDGPIQDTKFPSDSELTGALSLDSGPPIQVTPSEQSAPPSTQGTDGSLTETVVIHRNELPPNTELGTVDETNESCSERTLSQKAPPSIASVEESEWIDPYWRRVFSPVKKNDLPFSVIGSSGPHSTESSANWEVISSTDNGRIPSTSTSQMSFPEVIPEGGESDPQQGELSQFLHLDSHGMMPQPGFLQGGFSDFQLPIFQGFAISPNDMNYLHIPTENIRFQGQQSGVLPDEYDGMSNVNNLMFPTSAPPDGRTQYLAVPDTSEELTPRPHRRQREIRKAKQAELAELAEQEEQALPEHTPDSVKDREMIAKGITRIRAKTIDKFGYRKLRNLVSDSNVFNPEDPLFDDLLLALLNELESAPLGCQPRKPDSAATDVKIQILNLLRDLSRDYGRYFRTYHCRTMSALIATRRNYPTDNATSYFTNMLTEMALDICVDTSKPLGVADAVLDLLETEDFVPPYNEVVVFGAFILSKLLARFNEGTMVLARGDLERLARFARKTLIYEDVTIRRMMFGYCAELYEVVPRKDDFWDLLGQVGENYRPLLSYVVGRDPVYAVSLDV